MAKERTLTPQERRLWRQATQQDTPLRSGSEGLQDPGPSLSASPPAVPPPVADAPPPARGAPKAPLHVLRGRDAARLLKPYAPVEARLDLHGMGKLEAYEAVGRFLRRAQAAGMRHVLIITGKGRDGAGVLRAHLPHWLNEPAMRRLLAGMAHPPVGGGGTGALHVLLKRQRMEP